MEKGKIVKVSGPLVIASGMQDVKMYEVVRVGKKRLIGEVLELNNDIASIQVYEETSGIGPGESVIPTGAPLSVELGPGLLGSIYDGTQRPLDMIAKISGDFIARGVDVPSLDREKLWHFIPTVKNGDTVIGGDIIGTVQETSLIIHKIMIPVEVSGKISKIKESDYTVTDTVAEVHNSKTGEKTEIKMMQTFPVRKSRSYAEKLPPIEPLITGQRVIDTFFPVAKGGAASIPGPFGSGKTVVQHQISKWANTDIIVFIGCGERGNEMADVLLEFPHLKDPKTNEPLIKRTVLIANTSNMPVSARESSIYTGITIAEYFRDMGYSVALMADSTSRWAEALREISGRLEEMPGDEGYPAYLSTRLAEFYERAGRVKCHGSDGRIGTLTVIGSVSPPGGDLSDPVVQATLRIVKVFWSLEDKLAYARHFPAISWLRSYTLYIDSLTGYFAQNVSEDFFKLRKQALKLLQEEASLEEIVRLVGIEALSPAERLVLITAKSLREDFLHQLAFDPDDTYTSIKKQYRMMHIIMLLHNVCDEMIANGAAIDRILSLAVREKIARMKFIKETEQKKFDEMEQEIDTLKKIKVTTE
ncbi:MAG: V-type sodium ATPase catalytic subunit A [Elusimicrobia bacterium ADurb.Bin231]|nr:MAG: V-type sodium ATPase catalytic subunit A [Elusimicrobia bacterium ADurb.Bin231]